MSGLPGFFFLFLLPTLLGPLLPAHRGQNSELIRVKSALLHWPRIFDTGTQRTFSHSKKPTSLQRKRFLEYQSHPGCHKQLLKKVQFSVLSNINCNS